LGRRLTIRIVITLLVLFAGGYLAISSMKVPSVTIHDVDFSSLADGTYKGAYVLGPVSAEVVVHVEDGIVSEIKIAKHDTVMGKPAEKIVDEIIKRQSLGVDVVSRATWSSKAIIKAIEVALTRESN